jgi:tRNA uridine 5-carbamoylmethylation protein Kti12
VVFTGGPCGGKSSTLGPLASALRAEGWQVRDGR